ncbi:PAS domain-containing sensor histidine kinase [Novosphingobium terrae]|uniref:PAS domain-containing sensor histidine kinase n=1 Tax=Novosphingobium terrae TaxID=2726189 RepID=UPI00197D0A10|nr:PAS domain-containing sensor histidine kinase [Novosphingobium terrae]
MVEPTPPAGKLDPDPLDLIDTAVIERSPEGVILTWNRAAERLYGWSRGEAVGLVQPLLLNCRPQGSKDVIERMLAEHGHWKGLISRIAKGGKALECAVDWHVSRCPAGSIIRVVEIGRLAETRSGERAPSGIETASEGAYRRLFQYVPISLWKINSHHLRGEFVLLRERGVTDLEAYLAEHPAEIRRLMDLVTVEDVNDKTIEMFGGTCLSDFEGPVTYFWQPSPGTFCRSISAQFGGATSYSEESVVLTLDGREINIIYKIAAPPLHDGQAMSIVSVVDISDRVRALNKLQESEARYRNLFQNFDVALLQLDMRAMFAWQGELQNQGVSDLAAYAADHPDFFDRAMDLITITEGNARAVKLFGASDARDLQGPVTAFWKTSPGTFARSVLTRLSGGTRFSEETRIDTLDGRVVDVLFTLGFPRPLTDAGINVVGFIDISERVAAQATVERIQAQFEQASRVSVLGELAASIAHEVNQPLAGIMSCAEASLNWLEKDKPDREKLTELVGYIIDDAQRAADIVSGIRDMAANRQREFDTVPLDEVVEGALQILRHELVANRVELHVETPKAVPLVSVDQVQIQQVIVNLAMNAMQAMSHTPAPRLTLKVSDAFLDQPLAYVTVTDNGPGIAPDALPRIFESLYTTKPVGLGMGLSICQRIVDSHRGTLAATNLPSGGASFTFGIPTAYGNG